MQNETDTKPDTSAHKASCTTCNNTLMEEEATAGGVCFACRLGVS